jgi:hypothetical protein
MSVVRIAVLAFSLNALAAVVCGCAAFAADAPLTPATAAAHEINFKALLPDGKGSFVKDIFGSHENDPECAKCAFLTLGGAAYYALNFSFPDERDIDGLVKAWRSKLAFRILNDEHAALSSEETTAIKTTIKKLYRLFPNGGIVILDALPMIDPAEAAAIDKAGAGK